MATVIRMMAQNPLIIRANFKLSVPCIQSIMVEEDNALMDELSVDIAAARTPAIITPRTPIGRW